VLNFNSDHDHDKSKSIASSVKKEFHQKTVNEKFKSITAKKQTDSFAAFDKPVFEEIIKLLNSYRQNVNLKTELARNQLKIEIPESALFNFSENRLRPQTGDVLRSLATKINLLSYSSKITVKIVYTIINTPEDLELNFLNQIYAIFERSNSNQYDLGFYVSENNNSTNKYIIIINAENTPNN